MTHSPQLIPEAEFLHDPQIEAQVERLNSAGLDRILQGVESFRQDGLMPLDIVRPLGESDRPLDSYDFIVLRGLGYGAGHHHAPNKVLSTLYAGLLGAPVVDLPTTSRSWGGMHPVALTKGWRKMDDQQRFAASLGLFDANAKNVQDSYNALEQVAALPGGVRLFGESMGLTIVASLATKLQVGRDVLSVGGVSMPNIDRRTVYGQLLLRDWFHGADMPGGMYGQMREGHTTLVPYTEAQGIDLTQPVKDKMSRQEYIEHFTSFYHDVIGAWMKNYRRSESFSRAISQPTAAKMIAGVLSGGIPVTMGYFENDPVSRASVAEAHFAELLDNPLLDVFTMPARDHAGCANPYATSYALLRSARLH